MGEARRVDLTGCEPNGAYELTKAVFSAQRRFAEGFVTLHEAHVDDHWRS
jgi:hypothetical protein